MKTRMSLLLALTLALEAFGANCPAFGAELSIQDRLATQRAFKERYSAVFGAPEYADLETFHKKLRTSPKKLRDRARKLIADLDSLLPPKILMPLVFWRVIEPSPRNVASVFGYHALNRFTVLRDFIDHPLQGTFDEKNQIQTYLAEVLGTRSVTTLNLFEISWPMIEAAAKRAAATSSDFALVGTIATQRVLSDNFLARYPFLPDHSTGWLGFIPGNRVELISENDRSMERIQWVNDRVIFAGGRLDWTAPYMTMHGPNAHVAFANDPIFSRIRDMVDSARDSIFIDIFLFGGTMGGTLARHLIDKTLEKRAVNPAFKTLILHDYATNYNMKDEMMPVFEYIRDRIAKEPAVRDSVLLLQANIHRHPPGIPFGITNLIPKTDEVLAEMKKKSTWYESKIDHSKVIVVDANTDSPQAYFGSKNWSDHSGSYYYDNALYVAGPGAAIVQAAYHDDVAAALTNDPKERRLFIYTEEGFGNDGYLPRRAEILEWFRVKRASFPITGDQKIRLAEANVDGTIMDARNMLIEMIQGAQSRIYMEQLFIYDKYINDALIKRKLQKPDLDIRILADHNGNFGMNGFPNTIFMKDLTDHGIEVRARRTFGITAKFPNGKTQSYHQENHRKITAIDGQTMMVGSSNLNPDTLQGSFREFGAQIFDTREIEKFERYFVADWEDEKATQAFDIHQFQMTIGGKALPANVSALINDVAATILRAKDGLEGRF
ncbi:MAG: hypothetical protein A2428_14150 [Bdellovibrionales bacterium RIFOXYC1_FULL_54_43]|nr:MAG: hypothetical protein A2428_14150 [Bdellovibrionales bacterium RIFOXYC1_FULL_54_43]